MIERLRKVKRALNQVLDELDQRAGEVWVVDSTEYQTCIRLANDLEATARKVKADIVQMGES